MVGAKKSYQREELTMKTYPIPMVPGPVSVPPQILEAYQTNYGSGDLETDFFDLYDKAEANLQRIMGTRNKVAIQSGEGMLALWAALKSCLVPGDRALSIATGVFGEGIGDMAAAVGAEVKRIRLEYNQTISDIREIENTIVEFKPKIITAVHCETPSGTLNPLADLGRIKKAHGVPLLYVDAVASIGGALVSTDHWNIDLCLGGTQKCLSSLPDLAFVSISDTAWEIINRVDYAGYDALKPFETAQAQKYFPYTPNWHAMAALNAGAERIIKEGLDRCIGRHEQVADYCRRRLIDMGLSLFPAAEAVPSPTVTAVYVPSGITWSAFDARLREGGLVVGGSYGPLAGKLFRLGHMGSQADMELAIRALDVIERAVGSL
jgi:aspartate aminotransferase-like enzyme